MANEIIIGKIGNQKLQITEPTVSRHHCKVTDNGDGTYTIENLSNTTYTKVDGREIIKTRATLNSRIQLGPTFNATLVELIGVPSSNPAPNPTPTPDVKTYSISHLKRVWEDYNDKNIASADSQRKIGMIRGGGTIFMMGGGIVATLLTMPEIGIAFSCIGVGTVVYSFLGMKNTESARERQARQDAFDEAWVCPNPDCKKTLPARNYRLLLKNHQSCPYCRCKYVE